MSEYERLTERTKHGIAVLDSGERFVLSCGGYATTKALNRLAELEDKIENGTLVPKYSIVDCGDTHCVCAVDTNNLLVIGEYETKAEAKQRLEELKMNLERLYGYVNRKHKKRNRRGYRK